MIDDLLNFNELTSTMLITTATTTTKRGVCDEISMADGATIFDDFRRKRRSAHVNANYCIVSKMNFCHEL